MFGWEGKVLGFEGHIIRSRQTLCLNQALVSFQ